MKQKSKNAKWILIAILSVLLITPLAWILTTRMEGELPSLDVDLPGPEIGAQTTLHVRLQDEKSGLKYLWLGILSGGGETLLMEKNFPAAGLLASGVSKTASLDIPIDTKSLGLGDGPAVLRMVVVDYSWRSWGKGNRAYFEKEIRIDTMPPVIEVLTKAHNVTPGGAGLVLYKVSEACRESGVMIGETFFRGYQGSLKDPEVMMAYFALNHRQGSGTEMFLQATDRAGNSSRAGFMHYIRPRQFRQDNIHISDRFLESKMPEFAAELETNPETLIDKFLYVNRTLRMENQEKIEGLTRQSDASQHWDGPFLRLPKAANRAGFADHRLYRYQDRRVDEQVHLGIDLASLAHSPVPAANRGKIVFAGRIGIYGNTIIMDHGFGLFSMYAHLSRMDVTAGQMVAKGENIGQTGTSGLAGGDHLHFAMMIQQTFINPIEWWDAAWIQNNITAKIETIGG